MPARLSIIIPTLNAEGDLAICLSSLVDGASAGLVREVVVSDGGSTDTTEAIARETGANWVVGQRGRAAQMIAGASAARGDWLLFLHADTALSPDWVDQAAAHMETSPNMAAAFTLAYRSDARAARWLERRANRRARLMGLPYGDQGILISRHLYDEIGGFEDVPLMEDVIIARTLGKSRLKLLPAKANTSAAKYERDGWRNRAWKNAWILTRFLLGASPAALAKEYR
jgi:rSAM/selenodomain-associated transferase 2